MASAQTLHLGPYARVVRSALDHAISERYLPRLWQKDASLFSPDSAVQASIGNRLGWLAFPRFMAQQVGMLQRLAQEVRQGGFTQVLLLGMGGSGLFSEVCRNTFGAAPGYPDLTVLDTTDPTAIQQHQQRCSLAQLLVIVSSKSGSTSEITALSQYFYEAFKSIDGAPGSHCIAITDAGTPLESQAAAWKVCLLYTSPSPRD